MDRLAITHRTPSHAAAGLHGDGPAGRHSMSGVGPCAATSRRNSPSKRRIVSIGRAAEARGALGHDVHHGLEVGRRAGDDPQDLGGGRLLLQGLGQLAVPGLELREQPHVLDRNDRLVGEGLEQRDLRLGEESAFLPRDDDRPIGSPSRSMGTARAVRKPACTIALGSYSGSSAMSTWTTARVRIARPVTVPRSGGRGNTRRLASTASGVLPCWATMWIRRPSKRTTLPFTASHNRAALWAIASKTGWASVGEPEMARRISAVAVCCSSASVSSRFRASSSVNSRTFSIAITAWSAKVFAARPACP